MLTIEQIMEIIPHRPPFLLIDRVLEVEAGVRAVGLKQVTINEPFFVGHFPGRPVMPGVLQVEAIAQLGALALLIDPQHRGKIPMFARITGVRFRQPVTPGDTLRLEVTLDKMRGPIGKGQGTVSVDGKVVTEGEFTFALVEEPASDA